MTESLMVGWLTDSMDMSLSKLWEMMQPGVLQSMGSRRVRYDLVTEQQQLFLRWKWGQKSGK